MENQINDWGSGLPYHLMYCVMKKIDSIKDFLQLGCVCQNWWSTLKEYAAEKCVSETPMLLVGDEKDCHAFWAYDVAERRFLTSKLSSAKCKRRFCGSSSFGWLASVKKDWSVTLYNPFSSSDSEISLPPVFPPSPEALAFPGSVLSTFQAYHVRKLVISAHPVKNRDECVAVAAVWGMRGIAVFRMGRDAAWSRLAPLCAPHDLMMLRGTSLVYGVGICGDVFSIDLDHMDREFVLVCPADLTLNGRTSQHYLVQSRGSGKTTYIVKRLFKKRANWDKDKRSTIRFEVSAIDLATGKCERVRSLGDNTALFLGDNTSVCVKASPAYLPNCIYFTHDVDMHSSTRWEAHDIGVFDLQTNKLKARYSIPESTYLAMRKRPPIFVFPTLNI